MSANEVLKTLKDKESFIKKYKNSKDFQIKTKVTDAIKLRNEINENLGQLFKLDQLKQSLEDLGRMYLVPEVSKRSQNCGGSGS